MINNINTPYTNILYSQNSQNVKLKQYNSCNNRHPAQNTIFNKNEALNNTTTITNYFSLAYIQNVHYHVTDSKPEKCALFPGWNT